MRPKTKIERLSLLWRKEWYIGSFIQHMWLFYFKKLVTNVGRSKIESLNFGYFTLAPVFNNDHKPWCLGRRWDKNQWKEKESRIWGKNSCCRKLPHVTMHLFVSYYTFIYCSFFPFYVFFYFFALIICVCVCCWVLCGIKMVALGWLLLMSGLTMMGWLWYCEHY